MVLGSNMNISLCWLAEIMSACLEETIISTLSLFQLMTDYEYNKIREGICVFRFLRGALR